ncbi:N-acetyltransferase [Cryobacterium sp. N19]|uniref:GNAT family N-acetyltransferase n=1 Tax=Cryobacterium sp. N19 TaxID=2048288 RepID=UPI000CE49A8A|nr:GNAT family N-acetyltransferase [Cryobacterium sp. N19]
MVRRNDQTLLFADARLGDGDAMRQLALRSYALYVDRIGKEPAPMGADYGAIAASGEALLVWQEHELVGMLVTHLEAHALLIENIAVSPDVQGSGLGTTLLGEAERIARTTGREEVRLYTNEAIVENLAFYARHGFEETHRKVEEGFRRVYFSKRTSPGHHS